MEHKRYWIVFLNAFIKGEFKNNGWRFIETISTPPNLVKLELELELEGIQKGITDVKFYCTNFKELNEYEYNTMIEFGKDI